MAKVLIGNIKGPQGEPGPQGIQGIQGPQGETGAQGSAGPQGVAGPKGETGEQGPKGETGQRGSKWYTGEAIDGISTTPAVYATGLSDVMADDYYMNVGNGHIYRCTEGGDADTAKWMFVGDINSVSQEELQELYEYIYDIDAINEVSGTSLLVPDGTDSEAADFKAYGRSEQVQYSGKNLWSFGDQSFTVNNKGVSVDFPAGTYTFSAEIESSGTDKTISAVYFYDSNAKLVGAHGLQRGNIRNSVTVTTTTDIKTITLYAESDNATSLNDTATYRNIQLEVGEVMTDYEPYVGGVASPNPYYPQAIKSVADGGWFDGELVQGNYGTSTGVFVNSSIYVCNKNPIPCNEGDTIKIIYGEVINNIVVIFYDKNMSYITGVYGQNVDEYECVAPNNAKYFNIDFGGASSALTPQTAKPITVTINGKYALIVKSKGKNLLKSNIDNQTLYGVTFTNNADGSIAVNGTSTSEFSITINDSLKLSKGTYIINGNPYNDTVTRLGVRVDEQWYFDYGNGSGKEFIVQEDTYVKVSMVFKQGCTFNTAIYSMIRPIGTDDTYEPYKETVTYIPLNEPLRSSLDGTVTDEVSLTEVTRRFTEVIFDGSEEWQIITAGKFICMHTDSNEYSYLLCTHYTKLTDTEWPNMSKVGIYKGGSNLGIYDTRFSTVDELKAWLQANPITVQYELAEPIVEEIDPASITIYDGVTHITAADNPEMYVEYYCDSSIGHRLAETIKEMRAEHVELNDRIGATSGRVTDVEKSVDKTSIKIDALNEAVGISKNLLRVTKTGDATTSGVTYAIDADKNYIFSGTATADISIKVYGGLAITSVPITESVIVSGCPEGGSENTYYAYAMISDDNSSEKYIDTGNECTYEYVEGSNASVNAYYIVIKAGTNVAGLVFKPMVRLASEADGTYEPNKGNAISMIKKKDRRALYNATGQATAILDYDWQNYNFITFCRDSSVGLQMPITLDPAGLYSSGGKVVYYLTNNTSAWVNISFPEEGKIKLEQSNAMVGVGDNYYYHVTGFMQIS